MICSGWAGELSRTKMSEIGFDGWSAGDMEKRKKKRKKGKKR